VDNFMAIFRYSATRHFYINSWFWLHYSWCADFPVHYGTTTARVQGRNGYSAFVGMPYHSVFQLKATTAYSICDELN
ncbi:MAG: hypothetical protein IJQ82_15460, partial [Selenomonadaceae bacterium]|nr:hypothetical protein [Selenomonadaceae bacterium]